ncbi:lysozyme C-like [Gopherus evgoodei]|uniref:lysozyme C-like n=1 Tax=Gopherus evgoodei TaxID=1825980 RepID=UPI0011CF0B53|nr:lysozyme C-like [Gopherus evgoodei]
MKPLLLLGLPLLLVLLAVMPPGCQGIIIPRCRLVRIFRQQSLEGFVGRKVADWVCLAKHESSYNTRAINRNKNGSSDYGIFQINSKYWCYDGRTPGASNGCRIHCRKFLDDNITDDIKCAKLIARQARGLTPWVAWRKHCRGKNLRPFVRGC